MAAPSFHTAVKTGFSCKEHQQATEANYIKQNNGQYKAIFTSARNIVQ
jgi:hypothetical protein